MFANGIKFTNRYFGIVDNYGKEVSDEEKIFGSEFLNYMSGKRLTGKAVPTPPKTVERMLVAIVEKYDIKRKEEK